jgi:hypothetical protein
LAKEVMVLWSLDLKSIVDRSLSYSLVYRGEDAQ